MASSRNSPSTEAVEGAVQECLRGLPSGASVAVALSGGLDSSVLLALAARHAEACGVRLSAIHVNHGLSPNAAAWEAFCQAACAGLGIPIHIVRVTIPSGTSEGLEATARRLRYQAFESVEADYVLLAHHANDQAETLIFNLMRGTGIRGAAAMTAVGGAGRGYLRPLLPFSRAELEACAAHYGSRWVDDESNEDQSLSRNYIRHKVIPTLEARFPAAVENLSRAAEHFAEAQEMLDEMARHDLGGNRDFPVAMDVLQTLSEARARNVLRYLIALRGLQAPAKKRLEEALRQFITAAPDRHPSLDLPSYRLFRRKGRVEIEVR